MITLNPGHAGRNDKDLEATLTDDKPKGDFVTTETIEQTPAQKRKSTATEHLDKLTAESERLRARQHAASTEVERLHVEIAVAERAGDVKTLTSLRKERQDQQQVSEDVGRILPTIDRELELARAELRGATTACYADRYNALVEQQRRLRNVISEALETLVTTIRVKEGLATKQSSIQTGDVGRPYANLSSEKIRLAFVEEITRRLLLANIDKKENSFVQQRILDRIDWSCRQMRADGELE
ncbi:MAG: hypothetical protein ABL970_00970 [Nitrospira sp.]